MQERKSDRKKDRKKRKFFSIASKNAEIAEAIDLEKGEGKISGTFDHEPKSAEEIIQLLKIDTDRWRLSQYWNKQMGDHWRVSALVSQIKNPEEKLFQDLEILILKFYFFLVLLKLLKKKLILKILKE